MPILSSIASASAKAYGLTSGEFRFTISSNQTNANLATLATSAGWDGASRLVATIGSGVYILANTTGTPALTVSGAFPGGVRLINDGYIVGYGGAGGAGGAGSPVAGNAGANGGTGLSVSSAISITNNGTIAGGGGGGGGGGGFNTGDWYGGCGGGGGAPYGAGGPHGAWSGAGTGGASDGSSATLSTGGAGGPTINVSAPGGAGGNWGVAGVAGTASGQRAGGGGGSAGNYVSGNSNVTWAVNGTRLGNVS